MNDVPTPPFIYEGLDPAPEPQSTLAGVSDAIKDTANRIGDAVEAGKRPGMPLSVLSNIVREAPLGSLLVAERVEVIDRHGRTDGHDPAHPPNRDHQISNESPLLQHRPSLVDPLEIRQIGRVQVRNLVSR